MKLANTEGMFDYKIYIFCILTYPCFCRLKEYNVLQELSILMNTSPKKGTQKGKCKNAKI